MPSSSFDHPTPIISLTSFPPRMATLQKVIKSLLAQKAAYKKIVLWLAEDEFPGRDIPHWLSEMQSETFAVEFCENLRSYKKLVPSLLKYQNDIIVTADDDIEYPEDWLGRLITAHTAHPMSIVALRAHRAIMIGGKFAPYEYWPKVLTKKDDIGFSIFPTGSGGVLYPPHALYRDITRKDLFMKYAPSSDDIWFWGMALLNNTKITLADRQLTMLNAIKEAQKVSLLQINIRENDRALANLLDVYPQIREILGDTTFWNMAREEAMINIHKAYKYMLEESGLPSEILSRDFLDAKTRMSPVQTVPLGDAAKCVPGDHARQIDARDLLDELLTAEKPQIFVDLGCGSGSWNRYIAGRFPNCKYLGVDILDSLEVNSARSTDFPFLSYNGWKLPLANKAADIVFMNQSLEHVRAPHLLLPEISRILADDGILCGSVSQLEPFHSCSVLNYTWYGLISYFQLFGLEVFLLRPGIDAYELISRNVNWQMLHRNMDIESIFFHVESPFNYKISEFSKAKCKSLRDQNICKLNYAGHVLFAAHRIQQKSTSFDICKYWDNRYIRGGNSGAGSYGRLAQFKAGVINAFIKEYGINHMVEFGTGDGNNLTLYDINSYLGIDISPTIVKRLQEKFKSRPHFKFLVSSAYAGDKAPLVLSLDVLFHLVNDEDFDVYMRRLFDASTRFVIIYAPNFDRIYPSSPHVRVRHFSDWIEKNATNFTLLGCLKNFYPPDDNDPNNTSWSDFYFYSNRKNDVKPDFLTNLLFQKN